ncbi:unnamed protein product [Urochloa decumbens]|uniref:GDSL esterase/lipase n=1 Tax=Urochloa decumbens TaxID=240449 RepID=A0ABC9EF56_9POAL
MLDHLATGAMIRLNSSVSYKSLIMVLVVLLACVSLLAASPATTAAARGEEVHLVPAVYVFGDSTVDVGNNQYLPGNSALQLPYGIDFPHSRPTGRFSNGYNVADFVAKLLGFKRSPPAYLSLTPRTSRQILRGLRGVNYASGGSGILDTTVSTPDLVVPKTKTRLLERKKKVIPDRLVAGHSHLDPCSNCFCTRMSMDQGNTITLTKQIEYFAATKSKMLAASGGGQGSSSVDDLLSKSLFLISDGGNDMFAFIQQNRSASEAPALYADLLSNYTRHLQALYSLGARRFGIVDVPPLGCVPSVRVISPDGATRCVDAANALASGFNDALRALLANLTATPGGAMPAARYSVGSSYAVVSHFTAHPAAAGFREVATACCGGGRLNAQTGCTPNATYCSDRDRFLFWDGVHGTQATSRKGAVAIFSAPPEMGFAAPINFKQLVSS